MTISKDDEAAPCSTLDIENSQTKASPVPMPLSQKICLSVTGGFLAVAIAVVFNLPQTILSLLQFLFVDYWIPSTIVLAIVVWLMAAISEANGEISKKTALLVNAPPAYYIAAWIAYLQYWGLSDLATSGEIMGRTMLFSMAGIGAIMIGVVGLTVCVVVHGKAPLRESLLRLPVTVVWATGAALFCSIVGNNMITGASASNQERNAHEIRPVSEDELKQIGEGTWDCKFYGKSNSVSCEKPKV